MSLASAVQEIRFLFQLLEDIVGNKLFTPVTLHCDNQGALAKNPVQHQRSKHRIPFCKIRNSERVSHFLCSLTLLNVTSKDNLTDIFAEPMAKNENFCSYYPGNLKLNLL